jgi:hypothetical protein
LPSARGDWNLGRPHVVYCLGLDHPELLPMTELTV